MIPPRALFFPRRFIFLRFSAVAAYDNQDRIARFSNYGKDSVHIGAPGVSIYSTDLNGYRFGDGTSFAAPFVTGTAALLKAFVPTLDSASLKERILATSDVISYYEKEKLQSAGRVNAYNALVNHRPPRPVAPANWISYQDSASTPHPYTNNLTLSFRFDHPGATHVRVHFAAFDTEAGCDKVTLRDRQNRVVAIYSGKLGEFWSADALGDVLVVEFQSDYAVTAYGFDIDSMQIAE